jgi:hypothetical protein
MALDTLGARLLFTPAFLSSSAPSQPGSPRDFTSLLGRQLLVSNFRSKSSESHRGSILLFGHEFSLALRKGFRKWY